MYSALIAVYHSQKISNMGCILLYVDHLEAYRGRLAPPYSTLRETASSSPEVINIRILTPGARNCN